MGIYTLMKCDLFRRFVVLLPKHHFLHRITLKQIFHKAEKMGSQRVNFKKLHKNAKMNL